MIPLIYFAVRSWNNRTNKVAYYFALVAIASSFSLGFYVLELLSTNTDLLFLWVRLRFVFVLFIPAFALFFVLAYVGREERITRRVFLILAIQPCITLFAMWTNDTYHLQWAYYSSQKIGQLVFASYQDATYSPVYWMGQIYLLIVSAMLIYVVRQATVNSPGILHGQGIYLMAAILLPASGIIFELIGLRPIPYLNWPVFTLCLSALPLGLALFRYHLLDILPAAQTLVLHNMQDAVLVIDFRGRIVEANPAAAKLLGEPLPAIVGHKVNEVFYDVPHLVERFVGVYDAQESISVDERDGTTRHFDLRISPLRNHNRQITGRILVLRDVGAAKRAEQHALELTLERERTQLLKSFISDTSHDIMTPISVMRVSTYLLRSLTDKIGQAVAGAHDDPTAIEATLTEVQNTVNAMREKSTNLDASALRLQTLVEGMLEMVKLDKQVFVFTSVDLNPVVEQTINLQRFLAENKGIQLEMKLEGGLPKVALDSNQFIRVLQNLLTNAIKYTPNDGTVSVRTSKQGERVQLEIQDTGEGIPVDDLPHIFDRMYRVDKTRHMESIGVGLGLGLAIVKTIVTTHQGTIEVESTVGKGSTFRICLPAVIPVVQQDIIIELLSGDEKPDKQAITGNIT